MNFNGFGVTENAGTPLFPESHILPLIFYKLGKHVSGLGPLESCPPSVMRWFAFSQRSSSPRFIEDEIFNDSNIMNNLIYYEDGQEEPDSLRVDKNMHRDPAFQQIGK
ncbi:hypothetical protein TNCV_738721 [Trichonephila clavipes]|nr:hypothetical protein TNCV_738721 [Trichonephila clavipes]